MKNLTLVSLVTSIAITGAIAACGGGQKTGSGLHGGDPGDPPPIVKDDGKTPDRVISKDARADFASAAATFSKNDTAGSWNQSSCTSSAETFRAIADEHKEVVEARYMQGLSYHRCNMREQAEAAYKAVGSSKPPAPLAAAAQSNLGELYYQAGKIDDAKKYWQNAVDGFPKVVGARNNLAMMILEDMRATKDAAAWATLEAKAREHLSSVLAVDNDNVKAYTLYGLVYLEGWQKNKNRLDLAKVLLDEGNKRNDHFAALKNAMGLYYLARGSLNPALEQFQAAVKLDPGFAEARMNVGLLNLGVRKFDTSKEQFSKVIELQPKNYDAFIGLGIAERGLGNFDGAEDQYKKAQKLDTKRGDAVFNLGVLYKDFKASKAGASAKVQEGYKTAREYFRQFVANPTVAADDKAEATQNIADCDKMIANLDDFIKAEAAAPTPAPATP